MNLRLDWCSHAAAKYAVEHWHYSKRMPAGKNVFIGVWEDERFIGVVIFGRGIAPQIGSPYALTQMQACELVRVALTKHSAPVSRIVSIAMRMLRRQSPGVRLVVSYADPNFGHNGGIYQAMNWVYVGEAGERRQWFVNGEWRNDVHIHRSPMRAQFPTRTTPRKHKYLYPLDTAMREQIAPLAKPYPKRAASIDSDAAGLQPADGGATPTAALQQD
jgi:hypothetical protein